MNDDRLIPAHGGYAKLKSFQMAEIVYDGTVVFCDRFVDRRSRTHDQMVQAARSGRQNIAEGSQASGTSKKTELTLVGVARASLEELLLDYQDYLRQHGLPLWGKNHPQAQAIRKLAYAHNRSYSTYSSYIGEGVRRGRRQHPHLPDPPDQLPPRPATAPARTAVRRRGRLHRAPLPLPLAGPQPTAGGPPVNPEQLLAHFDRISEAPDAIPRLRRFILDLAVRGKLVEQDPNDEPASELLKRIQAEKARLIKRDKLRIDTAVARVDADEGPFEIPSSWHCGKGRSYYLEGWEAVSEIAWPPCRG